MPSPVSGTHVIFVDGDPERQNGVRLVVVHYVQVPSNTNEETVDIFCILRSWASSLNGERNVEVALLTLE